MSPILIGVFLVAHGLITTLIGFGAVTNPAASAIPLPAAWFAWWPGPFGTSWLFEALHLGSAASVLGGVVWLASGLLLVGGGLGWIGIGPLEPMRIQLLVGGAAVGLLALALYFHPFYLVAVLINLAIIGLLWGRLVQAAA